MKNSFKNDWPLYLQLFFLWILTSICAFGIEGCRSSKPIIQSQTNEIITEKSLDTSKSKPIETNISLKDIQSLEKNGGSLKIKGSDSTLITLFVNKKDSTLETKIESISKKPKYIEKTIQKTTTTYISDKLMHDKERTQLDSLKLINKARENRLKDSLNEKKAEIKIEHSKTIGDYISEYFWKLTLLVVGIVVIVVILKKFLK